MFLTRLHVLPVCDCWKLHLNFAQTVRDWGQLPRYAKVIHERAADALWGFSFQVHKNEINALVSLLPTWRETENHVESQSYVAKIIPRA